MILTTDGSELVTVRTASSSAINSSGIVSATAVPVCPTVSFNSATDEVMQGSVEEAPVTVILSRMTVLSPSAA